MTSRFRFSAVLGLLLTVACAHAAAVDAAEGGPLRLTLRARQQVSAPFPAPVYNVAEKQVEWDTRKTAVIIIDVWDKHWCAGANRREAAMVPRMNQFVSALRERGVFVIHAPSDTMKTYEGTPARKLAQAAPAAAVPAGIEFKWNYCDPKVEGELPIDDSDGGCDCQPQCKTSTAWKAQHSGLRIAEGDAVSDNGREVYNLLQQRGIDNVIVCGVHTNMCVLGRPFGIRQLRKLGKNAVLVRDLTDTMYNPRSRPFVPHERGTDLVVAHVEKNWCPTITSDQVLGKSPGRDAEPRIVFVLAEDEYDARSTMPAFASEELGKRLGWKPLVLHSDSKSDVPGLDAIDEADLLVLYMRRRTLPEEQLERFKKHFAAGKPVVALRTSSHAFQNWLEFDDVVLGCNYTGHHGKGTTTRVAPATSAARHPGLRGVTPFRSAGSLYKSSPLAPSATPLLAGSWKDAAREPVAWTNTHNGGRVFYTSLGHVDDFKEPSFRRLLLNGILWALDRPIPR